MRWLVAKDDFVSFSQMPQKLQSPDAIRYKKYLGSVAHFDRSLTILECNTTWMNKEQATNISHYQLVPRQLQDWIGLSSVLRCCQQSIGYIGDSFYRWKDPTNSIKVLKVHIVPLTV